MSWPPLKAWTKNSHIYGFRHFVAINYGGESMDRWVALTSVLDGTVSIIISWSELQNRAIWSEGWIGNDSLKDSHVFKKHFDNNTCSHPSEDSGLSIPISKNNIRPWFINNQS